MTKAERIYNATRRQCKDIITGTYGYMEGQSLSGLVTEEAVCMRTINAIMKLVDKEEHRIRLDEELGVLSGEKLQLYINVNNMVRKTVEDYKAKLQKWNKELKTPYQEEPETAETVESVEETTVSETETAEQETELNAEVAQVEAEQTAEQTEENNIPHTVNRGRKSKGLNGYEQTVFSKRLKALHENTNEKQADTAANLGVTRQSFNNWLNAVNEPDFATLIKIAKYYNTSVDYLLGLSDIESLDSNIKASCTTTGLSQAAVEKLALWTSDDDKRKLWTDYLSYYITSPDFEKALEYINKAHNCYNGDLNEDVIVKLWQVSRKIEVVTESLIELEEIPQTGYFDTS